MMVIGLIIPDSAYISKNLKHKKKYYVIVRGYKKIKKGKRYIPEFSPVNKLTITI